LMTENNVMTIGSDMQGPTTPKGGIINSFLT